MPGPWEKYTPIPAEGPWTKYGPPAPQPAGTSGPLSARVTGHQPGPTRQPGVVEDVAKSVGSGLVTGAEMLVSTPGFVEGVFDVAGRKVGNAIFGQEEAERKRARLRERGYRPTFNFPSAEDVASFQRKITGFTPYEPQTTPGRFANTIAEFVPATAALGPAGGLRQLGANALKYAAVPGAASEAAGQATEGTAVEPYARAVAALLAGGGAAFFSRPKTAARALRNNLPRGMSAADINAAEALMVQAQQRGINLTLPEALAQSTKGRIDLTDLQRVIEQSHGGRAGMSDFMAGRPEQARTAMAGAMDDLTWGASLTDPVRAGLSVQRHSKGAIRFLRQRINKATERLYATAGVESVSDAVFAGLKKDPLFREALAAVRADPVHSRFGLGMPDRSVAVLDQVKKHLDDLAGAAGTSGRNAAAATYGSVARESRDAAIGAAPEYGDALFRQSQLRRNVLEPAEAGPLGKLAATDDIGRQGRALFPAAPVEGAERIVAQTVRRLVRQDPSSAFQVARTNLRQQFDEATQNLLSGPNQWGPAKFAAVIRGNSQQAKNLEAAVRALPDGAARWQGLDDFLQVLEATGRRQRPGSMTAFNAAELESLSKGSALATGATKAASPARAFTAVADFYKEFMLGRNTEQLARIITDPKSARLLRSLSRARTDASRSFTALALIENASIPLRREPR